ncbi:tRNA pseudouridine synthase A [Buchnera aphidicola str. Ak (Acyrthosiphon kondoi)]|uniref:tRNA pseudouridine synthase A n=1 Tax=Buchnera aphidicola str. Ak (Acyrthosiphon kondoi) TaxID=1005090 RepID=G2LMR9_9GAMM|nr:tRNA pseudouridine(38-40) synthase TruA [Buchnera aphidicola]AEO08557.1 tRNA pseudouridine synthase A [Buchnera aphidicola str. Ak (Acyrthosiphon kondoi)]WAI18092.1 MAG: tRNA pseudouridine(38-40) synthase TruA [Buchnera aphidicola (Acyrthosiphon caraganae)]
MALNNIKRFALGVEYDGSFYHGWQRQKRVSSIQEEIERALSIIANHKIDVICAGRTDAGVHSIGQVIHFSTTAVRKKSSWSIGVNSYLSKNISIVWVKSVPESFHARYSAITRSYRYIIYNYSFRSAIFQTKLNHVYRKLNVSKMHSEAQFLLGEHDFTSFRALGCQSYSPYRNIKKLNVFRFNHWVVIDITANSFLHHMVRNIVGSLIEVGMSKKKEFWMKDLLRKKDRSYAGATAPAQGLYLVYVEYPSYFNFPRSAYTSTFFE